MDSQQSARQQAGLNQLVIQEMSEGLLVIDRYRRVLAVNPSAQVLLGLSGSDPASHGSLQRPEPSWWPLLRAVERAHADGVWPAGGRVVSLPDGSQGTAGPTKLRVRLRFTRQVAAARTPGPEDPEQDLCVLLLEDERVVQVRVQQEKLAAMGRVSAGIAHEIRNPLAAIAQANELLSEDRLGRSQVRLVSIIADNVVRLRRLVDDDIQNHLWKMDERGLAKRRLTKVEELTSRKDSTDIPKILDHLEMQFDPKAAEARKQARKEGRYAEAPPIDVLLATNMVSVGVDVKRLGLMVVGGQPKTTAEYIQATSRVGRSHPGLVLTVYNWARPRDLSHYERFEHYHATFYRHVESLSVTPFAQGAIERGLTALLVSLVRQGAADFNGNDGARAVQANHPAVKRAVDAIVKRAEAIVGKAAGEELRGYLKRRLDDWAREVKRKPTLGYQGTKNLTLPLLKKPEDGPWTEFTCPNSLREVEPSAAVLLDEEG